MSTSVCELRVDLTMASHSFRHKRKRQEGGKGSHGTRREAVGMREEEKEEKAKQSKAKRKNKKKKNIQQYQVFGEGGHRPNY